ncbi:protein SUPPRESSOR OF PHYA-105 1 [Argentina anserina]|uniref:protein SUPPRESSOR OF PHYA-105 1 n=1 Tax=Argentina anserina TaxID=57926 RepID=UPI0021767BDD|nr:protein SUPPRESSOR OF PHYA-105 1 [Potentilla anserina]
MMAELNQKDSDLKEGKALLRSATRTLPGSNQSENFSDNYSTNMEDKDLSKRVTASSGYEPLCRSPHSITSVAPAAVQLKLRHLRKPQSADYSQVGSDFRSKDSQGDFVSGDSDQMLLRVSRELRERHSGIQSVKPSSSNSFEQDPDKMLAYVRARNSKIISSNMLSNAKKQLKIQSTNSHLQTIVEETSKGKGISKIPVMDRKVSCGKRMKSVIQNGQHSSVVLNRSGPESLSTGICLREWLEPGCHRVDIAERLLMFRQIVELVDFAHCQGVALQELRPSCFILLPSNEIIYTGASAIRQSDGILNRDSSKKRLLDQGVCAEHNLGGKQRKLTDRIICAKYQHQYTSNSGSKSKVHAEKKFCIGPEDSGYGELQFQNLPKHSIAHLEETWYTSPEDLGEIGCTLPSNIYALGILLFELLCCCESWEVHSAVMLDLHHRILPPDFLSRSPMEAGFCFWLLHPEPLSRPTSREILQSELIGAHQGRTYRCDDFSNFDDDLEAESGLRSFLLSIKDEKYGHASKLIKDIRCLEEDISKFTTGHFPGASSDYFRADNELSCEREQGFCLEESARSGFASRLFSASDMNETQMMKSISQLDNAYFSARSQMLVMETASATEPNKNLLDKRDNHVRNTTQDLSINKKSGDPLGAFFDGLSKFACHKKFKECGTLRNSDLLNSSSAICSLSFDRDEDHIATAGVSKKIKIFDFNAIVDNSLDIHYPSVEMSNNSRLSSVCWNNYFKSYLASSDYDGVVQIWDANTGQGICQHKEHKRRAWSVDFSQADPTKFASGSDDFSVRLWHVKEENSINTIWNPANVCFVQFSAYSSHLLILGCADYKIYGYDLRHTKMPWCTLPGHAKAVSYVRFVDKETLVSASTDNTLKLWDLNKSSSNGSSNACSLTFSGHTNEKNFVGLSVFDDYIACGSETNEVYNYHKSVPIPITSHKFDFDHIPTSEFGDSGPYVSSVCWRRKSSTLVAANSSGTMKLLHIV